MLSIFVAMRSHAWLQDTICCVKEALKPPVWLPSAYPSSSLGRETSFVLTSSLCFFWYLKGSAFVSALFGSYTIYPRYANRYFFMHFCIIRKKVIDMIETMLI